MSHGVTQNKEINTIIIIIIILPIFSDPFSVGGRRERSVYEVNVSCCEHTHTLHLNVQPPTFCQFVVMTTGCKQADVHPHQNHRDLRRCAVVLRASRLAEVSAEGRSDDLQGAITVCVCVCCVLVLCVSVVGVLVCHFLSAPSLL